MNKRALNTTFDFVVQYQLCNVRGHTRRRSTGSTQNANLDLIAVFTLSDAALHHQVESVLQGKVLHRLTIEPGAGCNPEVRRGQLHDLAAHARTIRADELQERDELAILYARGACRGRSRRRAELWRSHFQLL